MLHCEWVLCHHGCCCVSGDCVIMDTAVEWWLCHHRCCILNVDCVIVDAAIRAVIVSSWMLQWERWLCNHGCCIVNSDCVIMDAALRMVIVSLWMLQCAWWLCHYECCSVNGDCVIMDAEVWMAMCHYECCSLNGDCVNVDSIVWTVIGLSCRALFLTPSSDLPPRLYPPEHCQDMKGQETLPILNWWQYSADMSPIKHLWDVLNRSVCLQVQAAQNCHQLQVVLLEESDNISQATTCWFPWG